MCPVGLLMIYSASGMRNSYPDHADLHKGVYMRSVSSSQSDELFMGVVLSERYFQV